ncbi:hypothetical protein [Streptomyces coeruleofuscus]|uniref:Uncharacterized protein n=1 Tax=Streptomyces coeruleofuscus TaxID=66879 RepID=A0ABP5VQN5_9ACTN
MIQQVPHAVPGADPAGVALALAVASELHAPAPASVSASASASASATRAPEVAAAEVRPARKGAARRAAAARRPSPQGTRLSRGRSAADPGLVLLPARPADVRG